MNVWDQKEILNENGKTVGYIRDRGNGFEEHLDENGKTIGYAIDRQKEIDSLIESTYPNSDSKTSTDYCYVSRPWWYHVWVFFSSWVSFGGMLIFVVPIILLILGRADLLFVSILWLVGLWIVGWLREVFFSGVILRTITWFSMLMAYYDFYKHIMSRW